MTGDRRRGRGGEAARRSWVSVSAACALLVFGVWGVSVAVAAPVGQITEFTAGLRADNGSFPNDIAPGSDGNLWFTDFGAPAIGRITPSGTITEFSAGLNRGSVPSDIAP